MAQLPAPLNTLSPNEVSILYRVLEIYTPEPTIKSSFDALRKKLAAQENIDYIHRTASDAAVRATTVGGDVVALSRRDSPMLKFMECPQTLRLQEIAPNISMNGHITVSHDPYQNLTITREATRWNTAATITLNAPELELITAFALYHMNKIRGDHVEYSTISESEGPKAQV